MKKASTYIPSVIIAVLLVFCFLGGSAAILADINVTKEKTISFAEKEKLETKAYASIEKHYKEKANATGIPAEVFTENISGEYLRSVINEYISEAYSSLESGEKMSVKVPENLELEASIEKFFNDYADETGYEKDEVFENKLLTTKENAYKTIGDYCDVFKADSMSRHGVLSKLSKLYSRRYQLTALVVGAIVLLIVLLTLIHRKDKKSVLYWSGISALISGSMGTIPSAYLIATKYYNSFSIKEPQVFAAYTRSMFSMTEAFMASQIAFIVIGICLTVTYAVLRGRAVAHPVKSTEKDEKKS
jgi:uncharacterized membrane protein